MTDKKLIDKEIQRRKALARAAFPNDLGNYGQPRSKRLRPAISPFRVIFGSPVILPSFLLTMLGRRAASRLLAVGLLLAPLMLGCQVIDYRHTFPDGSAVHASGASVLEKIAIQELELPGKLKLSGYQRSGDAEAIKAAVEGAVQGAVKAAIKP